MTPEILSLIVSAALGTVWTVDDNGPANFATIGAAIAAVPAGDVIVVEPGNYPAFTLGKRMTISGRAGVARPQIAGQVVVANLTTFTLAGLAMQELDVHQVSGFGRIDDCTIGDAAPPAGSAALSIATCLQIEVARTLVRARDGTPGPGPTSGSLGAKVTTSNVVFVAAQVIGGEGGNSYPAVGFGANGGDAVLADSSSDVTIAGPTEIRGGKAGYGWCGIGTCPYDGDAGDGVEVKDSKLRLRGDPANVVTGGEYWPSYGGSPGFAIRADHSSVVASGVTLFSNCIGCTSPQLVFSVASTIVAPPAFEPWLEVSGADTAGASKSIVLHAPGGAAILFGNVTPAFNPIGGLGYPLWLSLPAPFVLPVTIPVPQSSVAIVLTLPPATGIEGVALELQAIFPGLLDALKPATTFVSNPAGFVIRP